MRIPKQYGSYKVDKCPFCGKQATTQNSQKVPVCLKHKDKELLDLKCQCGDYLDVMYGKYGPFFNCLKCGNIRWSRGIELNTEIITSEVKQQVPQQTKKAYTTSIPSAPENRKNPKEKKETVITSDDVDVYFS